MTIYVISIFRRGQQPPIKHVYLSKMYQEKPTTNQIIDNLYQVHPKYAEEFIRNVRSNPQANQQLKKNQFTIQMDEVYLQLHQEHVITK